MSGGLLLFGGDGDGDGAAAASSWVSASTSSSSSSAPKNAACGGVWGCIYVCSYESEGAGKGGGICAGRQVVGIQTREMYDNHHLFFTLKRSTAPSTSRRRARSASRAAASSAFFVGFV